MADFIVCVIVITFAFGIIFVADGFGRSIKETLYKLINLKVEDDKKEE